MLQISKRFFHLFILSFYLIIMENQADVYNDCHGDNTHYTCLTIGSTNCIEKKRCQYIVGLGFDPSPIKKGLKIVLYSTKPKRYVAVALSEDQIMDDDDVIACFMVNGTHFATFYGRNYDKTTEMISVVQNLPEFKGKSKNGGFECKWDQPLDTLPVEFKFKNFEKVKYRLFGAAGEFERTKNSYNLKFHGTDLTISKDPGGINFSNPVGIVNSGLGFHLYTEHKVHIFCMIWTWMFFIPVGIIISKYYKETWAKVRIYRRRIWFILHVSCMWLGVVLSIIGYFAIVYKNRRFFANHYNFEGLRIHQIIGGGALGLLWIQSCFNWFHIINPFIRTFVSCIHVIFGITCYCLGFFDIVTAHIFTTQIIPVKESLEIIGIVSILILALFYIFLSSFNAWTDSHLDIHIWRSYFVYPMPMISNEEAPRPTLRKSILVVFILMTIVMSLVTTIAVFDENFPIHSVQFYYNKFN